LKGIDVVQELNTFKNEARAKWWWKKYNGLKRFFMPCSMKKPMRVILAKK